MQACLIILASFIAVATAQMAYGAFVIFGVSTPNRLIVDLDIVTDAGDVGALQVAMQLSTNGETILYGVVTNSSDLKSAPCVRVLLDKNGFSSVQVGAYMGNDMPASSGFTSQVVSRFGNSSDTRANYTDATTLLRQLLAAAPNRSITYASIGFGVNLSLLLQSPADGISSLNGVQLFAAKVKSLVIMGGEYPSTFGGCCGGSGVEYNFQNSPVSWNYVFTNKTIVPTNLWGFTPPNTVASGPAQNGGALVSPSYYAYTLVGDNQGGGVYTRPDWDQFAILYAVRGNGALFATDGSNGTNAVNSSTGANSWTATSGLDSYLKKTGSDGAIGAVITGLMSGVL